MKLLLFVGLVIAIWRVTRLLVKDEFPPTLAIRVWAIYYFGVVTGRDEEHLSVTGGKRWGKLGHAIAYIFTCPWCMSFYVGLIVWGLADWRLSVPYPWLIIAAGSGFSGVMSQVESRLEGPQP